MSFNRNQYPQATQAVEVNEARLVFTKSGAVIQESIGRQVGLIHSDTEARQARISDICKTREIDPKEVIEAGDDYDKVSTYSEKISNRYLNVGAKSVLDALQADLQALRNESSWIASNKRRTERLERMSRNMDAQAIYPLQYSDLVELGF